MRAALYQIRERDSRDVGRKRKHKTNLEASTEVETWILNEKVIGRENDRDRRVNLCLNLQFRGIFDTMAARVRQKAFSVKLGKIDICLPLK
jgi:hypothetical protein